MQIYKITDIDYNGNTNYAGTFGDAHDKAKEADELHRAHARVELVEIASDKATILSILSGNSCAQKVLRTWSLTPRGGLQNIANGE